MQNQPSLFARDDTFLGVCEALGEDFGFNPLYLRLALAAFLLWNPVAVMIGYVGAGVIVAVSRRVFPKPDAQQPVETVPEVAHNDDHSPDYAMAA